MPSNFSLSYILWKLLLPRMDTEFLRDPPPEFAKTDTGYFSLGGWSVKTGWILLVNQPRGKSQRASYNAQGTIQHVIESNREIITFVVESTNPSDLVNFRVTLKWNEYLKSKCTCSDFNDAYGRKDFMGRSLELLLHV